MKVATYEAIVQDGQIKLVEPVTLPERAKVDVGVTGVDDLPRVRIMSPRLAHPGMTVDFVKEVSEESQAARLR